MAITRKVLAHGTLTAMSASIYTPTGAAVGYPHTIRWHNTTGVPETVIVGYDDGAAPIELDRFEIQAFDSITQAFPMEGDLVENGHDITAYCSTASAVTYKISGTEAS